MPSANSHLIGGLVGFGLLVWLSDKYQLFQSFTLFDWCFALIIYGIYSLLADVDKGDTLISRAVSSQLLLIILVLGIYYYFSRDWRAGVIIVGCIVFMLIMNVAKHRGGFHSVWAAVLLSAPLYLINPQYFWFGLAGYGCHLLLDKIF